MLRIRNILVDMSLTTVHHGHVRILKIAYDLGYVIVALVSDDEIYKSKGFYPILSFENRKEIALAFKYVQEVDESDWLIDEKYLDDNNIDLLVNGDDNQNPIPKDRLVLFERTIEISITQLRNSNRG